jgi:hypothetical protein
MGLDQYLYMNIYTDQAINQNKLKLVEELRKEFQFEPFKIVFSVGYWRKAYNIHKWFEDNCDFDDNGSEVFISFEKLIELKKWCEKKIADKNEDEKDEDGNYVGNQTDWDKLSYNQTIEIIDKIIRYETLNKLENSKTFNMYTYTANW